MKFRPLHDRVVIRRAESDTKSKGGIIIPDNAKEKPQEGEVIAVGSGVRDESGTVQPLDVKAGDRVVVRRIKEDQKTAGGIIIPDTVQEKPQEGEVISVGPGAPDNNGKLVPTTVKSGDYVLFGKWSGTEVKLDGEELLIMKEADIMGVIEKAVEAKKAA